MNKRLNLSMLALAIASMGLLSSCNGGGSKAPSISENGYSYIHHIQNEGAKPQVGDYAYFQIDIFVDDSLLQSSRENNDSPLAQIPTPEELKRQPNPVIDVLPLMSVGDSITITEILDSLPQRPPGFDKFEAIIYKVILTDIKSEEEYKVISEEEQKVRKEKALVVQARLGEVSESNKQVVADYAAGKLNDKLTETESGLKYLIHEEGTGELAKTGEPISVHYYGVLTDGTMFDNSFSKGEPIVFPVGQGRVIPGWDEGLTILKKGTKATLFIPYKLAYGDSGRPPTIPAKADLIFYVELQESVE